MGLGQQLVSLLYYRTVKIIEIRNWKLGALHYCIMALIFAYIIGWVIVYKQGYQTKEPVLGNNFIKVKGAAFIPGSDPPFVFDAYDLVQPPKEENAVFLATNIWITKNQTRRVCSGNAIPQEKCSADKKTCVTPKLHETPNGISTGECNTTTGFCNIYGWCEVENASDSNKNTVFAQVKDWTIFVRSTIRFPAFDVNRDNANGTTTTQGYNLFTVNDLLRMAKTTYDKISVSGGAVSIDVQWNCNLDQSVDLCQPKFEAFLAVDSQLSPGYNFRYTKNYYLQQLVVNETTNQTEIVLVEYRDLIKLYGIRFLFLLSGTGRKFDIVPLMVNVGSGFGLLTLATLVSDFLLLYVLPHKKYYQEVKIKPKVPGSLLDEKASLIP